jgi:hypothetical protein
MVKNVIKWGKMYSMVHWKFFNLVCRWLPWCKFYANVQKNCNNLWRKSWNHGYGHPFNVSHVSKVIVVLFCTLPLVGTSQKGLKCIWCIHSSNLNSTNWMSKKWNICKHTEKISCNLGYAHPSSERMTEFALVHISTCSYRRVSVREWPSLNMQSMCS